MKKWILAAVSGLLVLAAAWFVWTRNGSATRVALIGFQPFQAAGIVQSNTSRMVKYKIVPPEEFGSLKRFDFVLGFGMGMRITAEQREQLKALPKIYVHAATDPENAIATVDAQPLAAYLDAGGKRNYAQLAHYIRREIDHKTWFAPAASPAAETPTDVFYHLDENVWFKSAAEYEKYLREKNFWHEGGARVAIIGGLSDPFSGNREHIDSLIVSLGAAGMNPFPVASATRRLAFLREIDPDAVIYLPHGRIAMMGGPGGLGGSDTEAVVAWLETKNIPVFAPLSMLQTREEWEADPQGMSGGFLSQSVVMPELDGAVYPYVIAAQVVDKQGIYLFKALPERLRNFTAIVRNFLRLKQLPNRDKKLAIVYFAGAQGMELEPSLRNVLARLKAAGYTVGELPAKLLQKRLQLGNIALVEQPRAGVGGDDFAVLHGTHKDPPADYIEAYRWIAEDFKADALLHFGTHGSLEFTPSKQVALCNKDWPDRLVGTIPHFYYYTIGNVGEAMIAKRRTYATTVSYLTPPFTESGLRGELRELTQAIAKGDAAKSQKIAVKMGFHRDLKLDSLAKWTPEQLEKVERFAEELASTHINGTLYTAGVPYTPEQIKATAKAMGSLDYESILRDAPEQEMRALLNALDGGYTAPSPGGDPLANPQAVPTGRNLYAINAEATPSEKAWEQGVRLAEQTLETYKRQHGQYPKKVAYTFWSSEFVETQGATLAQVLWMLGVEPVRDRFSRVTDLRLVPLNRPRVDVLVQTSGQFRDLAASRLALIDRAVRMAAAASDTENYVRENTVETERQLVDGGMPPQKARQMSTARVFGGLNGMYGTGIQGMTTAGDKWNDPAEIAEVYMHNMGAVYGDAAQWGTFEPGLLKAALNHTDAVVQPRQSNTWGALSLDHVYEFMGGMTLAVRQATGHDPDGYFADYRNRGAVRMQELREAIGVEARTTLLNPAYVRAMMKGGASSAARVTEAVTNMYGWSVMKPAVIEQQLWNDVFATYIQDDAVRGFLRNENPAALQEASAVMLESARKGLWKATPAQVGTLAKLHATLGVQTSGVGASNDALQSYIASKAGMAAPPKKGVVLSAKETPAAASNSSKGALWAGLATAAGVILLILLMRRKWRY